MDQGAVRQLARQIVERAAPDEAPELDTLADAYFEDPARMRAGDKTRKDPLGFGDAETIAYITPAVLFVADHVLSAVLDAAIVEGTRKWWSRRRNRHASAQAALASTDDAFDPSELLDAYGGDLERIRETARAAAAEFGVDSALAGTIAEVVVAVLSGVQPEAQPLPPESSQ
ncbi:hypothetical protein [Streptacidiphilus sp. EB103A]|uniref:hypothetical protein n=1 Tax=Streptacidiphilus sp. EB103A TaxID=3156275 RepID=UPI003519C5F1